MKRKGLGKGLGMGYKNLAPMDSHVHSLSAKGIASEKKIRNVKKDWMKAVIKFEDLNPDYPSSQMHGVAIESTKKSPDKTYIREKIRNTKNFYDGALDNFEMRIMHEDMQEKFTDRLLAKDLDAKGERINIMPSFTDLGRMVDEGVFKADVLKPALQLTDTINELRDKGVKEIKITFTETGQATLNYDSGKDKKKVD